MTEHLSLSRPLFIALCIRCVHTVRFVHSASIFFALVLIDGEHAEQFTEVGKDRCAEDCCDDFHLSLIGGEGDR